MQKYKAGHIFDISIHALREEGDPGNWVARLWACSISIHALREEGDQTTSPLSSIIALISIHALREEGDPHTGSWNFWTATFLSTPSARRATCAAYSPSTAHSKFLSTPSARRATGECQAVVSNLPFLSTPSARRATRRKQPFTHLSKISIHALREEGDSLICRNCKMIHRFLSTPSARRATILWRPPVICTMNFYPRPPRGGRLPIALVRHSRSIFLSTPSARRATRDYHRAADTSLFLSTPSARRATAPLYHPDPFWIFLSTPSARRATRRRRDYRHRQTISIHALREEGDLGFMPLQTRRFISIHALREEGDTFQREQIISEDISIHALREEGDISSPAALPQGRYFYPRPPRGGRHD